MSGQGREEKGLFPKGMILACVILFLLGIGCVGMNLAAGPSEEKNPMGQIADYRKKEEKKTMDGTTAGRSYGVVGNGNQSHLCAGRGNSCGAGAGNGTNGSSFSRTGRSDGIRW